jgi:SdrD B-like domain
VQFSGQLRTFGEQTVEVGASDVNDVVLAVQAPGKLQGQISVAGVSDKSADVRDVHVNLMPAEVNRIVFATDSETKADGSFTINNVTPGKYRVNVWGQPAGTYVASVRYGSQEVLDKDLDLSQGPSGSVEVVISPGAAELRGTVTAAEDASSNLKTPPRATVILFSDPPQKSRMKTANTDQNAAFSIKGVSPGRYRAIALENANMELLQDPEFAKEVSSHGTEIELRENDKKQIQLAIVPEREVHQVEARLGIDEE